MCCVCVRACVYVLNGLVGPRRSIQSLRLHSFIHVKVLYSFEFIALNWPRIYSLHNRLVSTIGSTSSLTIFSLELCER